MAKDKAASKRDANPINKKVNLEEKMDLKAEVPEKLVEKIEEGKDLTANIKPSYHANPNALVPCNAGSPWCEWGYLTKHPVEAIKEPNYFVTCIRNYVKKNDVITVVSDSDKEHWRGEFIVLEANERKRSIKVKLLKEYKF